MREQIKSYLFIEEFFVVAPLSLSFDLFGVAFFATAQRLVLEVIFTEAQKVSQLFMSEDTKGGIAAFMKVIG